MSLVNLPLSVPFQELVVKSVLNGPFQDLAPPEEYDISAFLHGQGRHTNIISQVVTDVISRFPDIGPLPEQLGGFWILCTNLRVGVTTYNIRRLSMADL